MGTQSFYMWSFRHLTFSHLYTLNPGNMMDACKFLQYYHVIRNLQEWGENWQGYNESFHMLRLIERSGSGVELQTPV